MNEQGCETFISDCHVRAAVELVSHTWDPVIVSALRLGPTRRSVLLDRIAGVSDKVLTESLRRLTARGLVARAPHEAGRDAAVYELTPLGASFAEGPLAHLAEWAAENQAALSPAS
ncbi:helix-turn-helix domain-containing protein [Amycolatopsis sp. SID8362]|uniref:winged helix-turn-helix transcriptional regulator n=1 Tax=Amycolatopsis sp. SID8362 TaxID=2690346 RepID=UPI00136C23B8|nr:helix-turn-helix domain-containing protein [Amycolatopsis sp. SID8362]NBH12109.1 transcriptional regulator [Amycolatopsis sp. SID8362]NED48801.1 helix-turn-helix transcriptional regulator [Amycolatopsis sp. SID8362]